MTQAEATRFMESGKEIFTAETIEKIEKRLLWAKAVCADSWENNYQEYQPIVRNQSKIHHPNGIPIVLGVATMTLCVGFLLGRAFK